MHRGLGLTALASAIIAIVVPAFGIWLTIPAAALGACAYGNGFTLGITSIIVNFAHIIFFSPLLRRSGGLAVPVEGTDPQTAQESAFFIAAPSILVLVQVLAMIALVLLQRRYNKRRAEMKVIVHQRRVF